MKQQFLIISIIFCSFISWIIGAFLLLHYYPSLFIEESLEIRTQQEEWKLIEKKSIEIQNLESEITQVVEDISPSVVSIIISRDLPIFRSDPFGFFSIPNESVSRKVGWGSGFFVSTDGKILTNRHVVQDNNSEYTVILKDGSEYNAEVLALDPVNDLALIKIIDVEKEFQPLQISSAQSSIKIGQFGVAIGNALAEFQNSVSLGIISGKNRTISAGGESLSGLLQTDAAINPGNSGWPLVDLNGKVIGINTAIATGWSGVGFAFALSQERIDYILESVEKTGKIWRPFIGINYVDITPSLANKYSLKSRFWAYIIDEENSIVKGSSADKNGIEPGDIILEVNNKSVHPWVLTSFIQNSLPSDILELKILKKSWKEQIINLELWEY